jgi:hypothetical protein
MLFFNNAFPLCYRTQEAACTVYSIYKTFPVHFSHDSRFLNG